jgi:hypothetical protein
MLKRKYLPSISSFNVSLAYAIIPSLVTLGVVPDTIDVNGCADDERPSILAVFTTWLLEIALREAKTTPILNIML